MWYRKNVPDWEGWFRIGVGLIMLVWGVFLFQESRGGIGWAAGGMAWR